MDGFSFHNFTTASTLNPIPEGRCPNDARNPPPRQSRRGRRPASGDLCSPSRRETGWADGWMGGPYSRVPSNLLRKRGAPTTPLVEKELASLKTQQLQSGDPWETEGVRRWTEAVVHATSHSTRESFERLAMYWQKDWPFEAGLSGPFFGLDCRFSSSSPISTFDPSNREPNTTTTAQTPPFSGRAPVSDRRSIIGCRTSPEKKGEKKTNTSGVIWVSSGGRVMKD